MRTVLKYLFLVACFLGGFAGMAWAQAVDVTGGDSQALSEALRAVADAFTSGNPTLAGVLMIVVAVAAVKKYGALKFPWLANSPFPELLVLLSSGAGALAAALSAGGSFTEALWPAAKLAAAAAGGYALLAALGKAVLDKWGDKLPAWLHSVLDVVFWLFKKPSADAKAEAKKAGDAAVEANPPTGAGDTDIIP